MEIIKLIVLAIGCFTAAILIYGAYQFTFAERIRSFAGRKRTGISGPSSVQPAE